MLVKFQVACVCIFLICSLFSCQEKIDSKKIALKVGDIDFKNYELYHYYTPFKMNYVARFKTEPPEDSVAKFKKWFVERAYCIADAYHNRYDTLGIVKKKTERMMRHEIAKKDGILWNFQALPKLTVSDEEEHEALEKMRKLVYFNITTINLFPEEFKTTFKSDTLVRNPIEYNRNLAKYKESFFFKAEPGSFQWPFSPFEQFREKLVNAVEGQVIGPIYNSNGIHYIYVTLIEQLSKESLNAYKKNIVYANIKAAKESDVIRNKEREMTSRLNIKIDESLLESFFRGISVAIVTDEVAVQNDTLMTYSLNGQNKVITAEEFAGYIRNYPEQVDIKNKMGLHHLLESNAKEDYLVSEANSIGVLKNQEAKMVENAIFHSMLFSVYNEKELFKSKFSDAKINMFYQAVRDRFVDGEVSYINRFDFRTEQDAVSNAETIQRKITDGKTDQLFDFNSLTGLSNLKRGQAIKYNDTTTLPSLVIKNIFAAPDKAMLGPIKLGKGLYSIIVKESEKGKRVLSFSELKDYLNHEMQLRMMDSVIESRTKVFPVKYQLIDNVKI